MSYPDGILIFSLECSCFRFPAQPRTPWRVETGLGAVGLALGAGEDYTLLFLS